MFMFSFNYHHHVEGGSPSPFLAHLAKSCGKTITGERFRVDGKHKKACHIMFKASEDLSLIEPTLDDGQKQQFSEALSTIEEYFIAIAEEKGKSRRDAASKLMVEVKRYASRVMTTSALQMAKISIQGRKAAAIRLYQKYDKNVDPIQLIRELKANLDGTPSQGQESMSQRTQQPSSCPEPATNDRLEPVDLVMDDLERRTEVTVSELEDTDEPEGGFLVGYTS